LVQEVRIEMHRGTGKPKTGLLKQLPPGGCPRVLARLDASRRHLDARIREAFGVFQHE